MSQSPIGTAAAFPDRPHRQQLKDSSPTGSSANNNDFSPFFPGTFATIPTADVWVPRPTSIPRSASLSKCRGRTGYVADFDHGCQTFFNCLPDGSFDKLSCPAGLIFDQDTLSCQKASGTVVCSAEAVGIISRAQVFMIIIINWRRRIIGGGGGSFSIQRKEPMKRTLFTVSTAVKNSKTAAARKINIM